MKTGGADVFHSLFPVPPLRASRGYTFTFHTSAHCFIERHLHEGEAWHSIHTRAKRGIQFISVTGSLSAICYLGAAGAARRVCTNPSMSTLPRSWRNTSVHCTLEKTGWNSLSTAAWKRPVDGRRMVGLPCQCLPLVDVSAPCLMPRATVLTQLQSSVSYV